jgi:hypothetical protein
MDSAFTTSLDERSGVADKAKQRHYDHLTMTKKKERGQRGRTLERHYEVR